MGLLLLFGWKLWTRLRAFGWAGRFASGPSPSAVMQRHRTFSTVIETHLNHGKSTIPRYRASEPFKWPADYAYPLSRFWQHAAVSNRTSLAQSRIGQTMREAF